MLDSDLARIYGTSTGALNRAAKRNRERFPSDFLFQISPAEWKNLKCQIGTSSSTHGGRRRGRPYAFTEHGAIMAANVLNSTRAVQMSVFVVRAFLKMRVLLSDKKELAKQLAALEKGTETTARHSRSRHRHHPSARDGSHRPAQSTATAAKAPQRLHALSSDLHPPCSVFRPPLRRLPRPFSTSYFLLLNAFRPPSSVLCLLATPSCHAVARALAEALRE